MPSLIPGYEYDIFISYRQKDNKHDGWVTEFVDNLKGELESTFKEEISVYFDINPHDGLLETHDVGDSLKEKLKCAVFIPIVSRTYCDLKSFAWENEFRSFIEMASKDQFGLKVKLAGGNVASRVLPVQIHDLDAEDKLMVENELGGFIRGIEFIYKEPGVNRPLRASEDHPDNNLNKTFYRNQLNKVANAIKEIFTSLRNPAMGEKVGGGIPLKQETLSGRKVRNIIVGILSLLVLTIAGIFIVQELGKPSDNKEISIAVLPFLNYSEEPDQEGKSESLTNDIISNLYKIKSFDRVVPFTSVLLYKKSEKRNVSIAKELDARYLLTGTYEKINDSIRITTNLLDPEEDKYLWQKDYKRPYKERITISSEIALQIADNVNAGLTKTEIQRIEKVPTDNQDAYDYLQSAIMLFYTGFWTPATEDRIVQLTLRAIQADPVYADAYAWAGTFMLYRGVFAGNIDFQSAMKDAMEYLETAIKLDPDNSVALLAVGNIYEWGRRDYVMAEAQYQKAIEAEPTNVDNTYLLAEFQIKMKETDLANELLKKAREQYVKTSASDIFNPFGLFVKSYVLSGNRNRAKEELKSYMADNEKFVYPFYGEGFIWLEEYDSARKYLEAAVQASNLYVSLPRFQSNLALAYYKTDHLSEAEKIVNQLKQSNHSNLPGSPDFYVGWYYSGVGMSDSAFAWLNKALKNGSAEMPWLKADPVFNNLKNDTRYWDLYEKSGHKAYDDYIAGLKK
jgi:TolB-like protein